VAEILFPRENGVEPRGIQIVTDSSRTAHLAGREQNNLDGLFSKFLEADEITYIDALRGLIAGQIINLRIYEHSNLLEPIVAMMLRMGEKTAMKKYDDSEAKSVLSADLDENMQHLAKEEVLAAMKYLLLHENDMAARLLKALNMGDLASHMAAGFGGRHMKRMMNDVEKKGYCTQMAVLAYKAAYGASERQGLKDITGLIEPLIDGFPAVIIILEEIRNAIDKSFSGSDIVFDLGDGREMRIKGDLSNFGLKGDLKDA